MKVRDSGMSERSSWEAFFEPATALGMLGLDPDAGDVVEFGCGYGTFTIPAARITRGTVHAIDLEPEMVALTRERAVEAGLANVNTVLRDFVETGAGVPDESAGYAMLFNILHHEDPASLLAEAFRVLRPGGRLGVMHWVHDASTPRGPSLDIRPRPEQCRAWAERAGFVAAVGDGSVIDLPPYHYGLCFRRPD